MDVETTGMADSDEVVELALVVFTFDRTGHVLDILDEYVGLRQPTCPIRPEAHRIHGLTVEALAGKDLDHLRVRKWLKTADVLIAHNAAFDSRFVRRLYPELRTRPWHCSLHGLPWAGQRRRDLQSLLREHGIQPEASHRGLADARAGVALLALANPNGEPYLAHLLRTGPQVLGEREVAAARHPAIFWGKFVDELTFLPLAAHCLDVAMVFRCLLDVEWVERVTRRLRGTPLSTTEKDRLSVLVMLHDAGKANLGFQRKVLDPAAPRAGHIRELAPLFDFNALDRDLHERVMGALPPEMATWFGDEETAYSYFMASFSHHGYPLRFKGSRDATYRLAQSRWWHPDGAVDPMDGVRDIVVWAKYAFPGAFVSVDEVLPAEPAFHHRFAGLVMLSDWLGSHPDWFPIHQTSMEARVAEDRATAMRAVASVGLDGCVYRRGLAIPESSGFAERFGKRPRPLQAAIAALRPDTPGAQLVIAEAETGSGKTEAALEWWYRLFRAGHVSGLYFALPTRVAARQIYERVYGAIARWFPDMASRPVTVLAVPGYPQVDGVPPRSVLPDEEQAMHLPDDDAQLRQDREWAAERPKRYLAATVAVGTIDQALLSGLQVGHAHLRSVCLDRSLLVVDEVHASDPFMASLLERLLEHHLSVGGHAMLLSATLGAVARQRYTQNKEIPPLAAAVKAPYAALTLRDGQPRPVKIEIGAHQAPVTPMDGRMVQVELLPWAFHLDRVVPTVFSALGSGARVAVMLNTVARAVALLRLLEADPAFQARWPFQHNGIVCPHHGRFAPADRPELDVELVRRFGPETPSDACVVVGTQTLEQSLDIDVDLLITDLAPADVLLQRVGRLHRHSRSRPVGLESARCIVLAPDADLYAELDDRGEPSATARKAGWGTVYEDLRPIELTRRFLLQHSHIHIPQCNRMLVEEVTHPECLGRLTETRWQRHAETIAGGVLADVVTASLTSASFSTYFGDFEFNETGRKVGARLGAHNLDLPLDRAVQSPFGHLVTRMVVPEHMTPARHGGVMEVVASDHDGLALRCGDRRYRYSRFGLEVTA